MNAEETRKILTIIKVAYPSSFKGLTKADGDAVVALWTAQFMSIPYEVMVLAVNKYISGHTFAPQQVSDLRLTLDKMYNEANGLLKMHERATLGVINFHGETEKIGEPLDAHTLQQVQMIVKTCNPKGCEEMSLVEMLSGIKTLQIGDGR